MIKFLLTALLFLTLSATQESASTKVILIGTAQDGGIPHIGCNQEICRTQKRFVSSLALIHDRKVYLIDASPDLRLQYFQLVQKYPDIASKNLFQGIFLTHAHMGHYAGLLSLGKESISTNKTPAHCSQEMATYLDANAPWNLLIKNGNIDPKIFRSGDTLDLGFKITPLSVPHRKEFTDTYGFLIRGNTKSLLYIPDIDAWEPVKEQLYEWLKQSDYALLDGTFYSGDELPGRDMSKVPHPTIQHSIDFLKGYEGLKAQIFFTHFNHTNPVLIKDSAEWINVRKAGFHIAVDWQEFAL